MHIKNIWKKGIAFGLSAVLAAGSITPVQAAQITDGSLKAAEEKAETSKMLAHYPLQSDVDDVSGNDKDAAVHGSVSWGDGLVLPGGKKTSAGDASYVTLPEGLFDGKDEVTISAWIKSNTDKGNYSALFFGTKAQSNNMPLNYWLFNPTNPSGNFKSVFTNDNNSGAPYQTEVGVNNTATTANKGVWTHYTTVLTEDSVTGYINGQKIGTTAKTKKTSDFGTGLQAYIGRSNYLGDNTYAGSFQDLRIYDDALDAQEVEDVYLTTDSVNNSIKTIVVDQIADKLSLDAYLENGILCKEGQIELPEEFYGAEVTWTSDQPEVISADGKVTLPSKQTVVKLTAEVKLGEASASRNFQITVLAKDGQINYWKEHLQIPYVLDTKTILPVTLGAVQVDWTQGGMIAEDGSVKADFEGKKKVTLKAVLNDGTNEETLEIPAYILGSDAVYAETYTRTPDSDYADKLAYSMHLAYSENGESDFTALNDNSGILYMRASENANETLTAKSMKDPYLFYTKEGGFAVAAVRTESNGTTDGQKASSVMIYKTENLMSYEEVGFLDLKTEKNVQNPVCEYDALADVYRITWNDGEGNFYQNTVKDLSTESSVSDPISVSEPQIRRAETGIAGAKEGNLVALENVVGTKLKTKLSKLVNTGVEVPEKITASSAADIKNVRATAYYNDGSTASKAVNWDLSDVDFKTGGTYTVNGTITQPTFHNENYLFYKRPDPEMVKYNGKFYFISTDENGQGKIYIRVSDTLKDIGSSEETLLLSESTYTDLFTACLWAPELHVIGDDLYLFFTGSKSNWAGVQSFVAKLKEGGDPTKTADWEKPVRVLDKDGNNLYEPEVGITLDMTYFEVDGQGYVVWAQRKRSPADLGSWLYIATVDSSEPWKLTSDRVCISKPDYGWDNNTTFVDEGPFVIQRDGNIFLTFSGAGVNPSYCVGILTAKDSDNLLDASSWTKGNYPILTSRSVAGQYGPGHNSYIYDDDGTLYNVYHAQWNKGARSASIRRVHFDIDGMPVLDLVEERDLLDEYKNVTMQVEVKASEEPQPEAELLAHYPLQNDAKDITENHNDGTINGTVSWSDGLVLSGGKKTSDASASYVTLPEGMLDQQDEVTISAWIKSNTDKGNYSALFFGTKAQSSNNMPLNYWLFNPTNPSGLFKSVFTDNNNSSAPYQTEAGVVAGDTTAYKGIWTHYTTVITKDSVTGYINGKKIGTAEKTKTTSDFGSGLQAYIGRSNYLGDNTYAGSFQDLRIYNGALNKKEVQEIYADTDYVNASVKEQINSEITSMITLEDVLPQGMITEEGTISLPQKVGDYTISWSSSDPQILSADGKVTLPENSQTVTLTASVEVNGKTVEKKLKIFVKGKKSQSRYLLVYNNSEERTDLGLSLHLGYSEDGTSYTALNSNTGICFAKNSGSAKNNNKNVLVSPYIFRKKDGGFGMIAANSNSGSVYLFDSEDLIRFTGERTLKISDGASVQDPTCEYDEEKDTYVIRWKNGAVSYQNESADLKTCTQAQAVTGEEMVLPTENIPDGAEVSQVFEVTEEEYTKVVNKLGVVTNTGVEKVERTLEAGSEVDAETLLPQTVTLNYSDGSTQEMNVTWDKQQLADLSTEKAGTYKITGTVQQVQYENPFIEQRADPCILKGNDGYYYFTASYPMLGSSDKNGYDKVVLRRAKTIEGLKDAEEVTIWDCDDTTGMYRYIWAPEIRLIAGNYYIYYTASTQANNVWGIRPHVLKCTNPEDIMNPASWEEKGRFQAAAGDTKAFSAFSLDMTYFENNGHHYAIWAQTDECSCLFMAEIDPEEPWKCISQSVRLSYPEYSWERVQENVNEGPSVLKKNGKIYVAYSASGTGSEYTMGLLSADENADLLDVNVWTKQAYPALTSADVPGEYGPGHNSFTVDENGNDIFVYHARSEKCYLRQCAWANQGSLYDPCRDARLKRVHYAADGTPILKMTYAQELADEFKTVTAKVTVEEKEETDESIVEAAKAKLKLENADPVIGNLTLPTEINGASVSWKSSDPSVISDQAQKNENYADTPAGVVVRGNEDKNVTLTATITYGEASATKSFPLTVKKKADQKEYAAYLYIHFNEIKVGTSLQQIYFGVSKDGLQWTALNDNQPILESTVGDKGVRDPYIIRSAEGDKFYLIGTDLDIHHSRYGGSWAQMATIGSQSLVIWESEDLVNWTESRLADVGSKINAGCTWAPEAIYDEKTGEYLVFWASPLTELTGDCNKKYIFVSKTRDFVNFTDPELYSDASLNIIDADLYKEGNKYYRLLKNSDKGYVYLQSADKLLDYSGTNISTIGGQQFVNRGMHFTKIDNTAAGCLETYTGRYEGPTMFKFNDRDEWCILVDEYGASNARGYIPFLTTNLDEPNSIKLAEDNTYTMTDGAKHGTVIPITQEEYDALIEKWGVTNKKYKEEQKDPILTYDFEETTEGNVIEDKAQDNDGTLAGNAVYRYDEEKQSNVLYLDGTTGTYAQLPNGLFDGLDNMTVTMDIKPESTQNFHFDFTVGQDNTRYLFLRIRDNEIRTSITSRGNGQEKSAVSSGSSILGKWMKVTLVMENHKMTLYINGEKAAEQKGVGVRNISELGSNLISYLGKSFYNDPYFKGSYDNVKVYNRALSEKEVISEYTQEKIRESAKALPITEGKVMKDLTLPTSGTNGTTITWKSDKPEYISETGKVTRPRAGEGNQKVTLTATISIGDVSEEYTYTVIVPEDTETENKAYLEEITEKFAPEWKYLWEDTKLQAQYKGMELTWKTDSPYISIKNGTEAVLAQPKPGEGEKEATLTAVFKLGNTTVEKEVKVIVEESVYGYVLSYVVSQEPDMQTEGISGKDNARTDVLHLALSTDGTSYTALNKEKGIFYPVDNKQLGSPSLFKKPDGTFGLIASADNANNKVMIYDSEDMIYYGNERIVTLTENGIVKNPEAVYDVSMEAYHVYWEDVNGQAWETQTKDFTAFTDPVQVAHSRKEVTAEVPRYAKEYTALGLTKSAYQKLEKKYGNLHNTGVQKPADIEINEGGTFTLPEKLTLDYSDGSTADMKVTWNTENVNTDKAGTYEVTGTIEQTKYNDPLVEMRADPYMIYNEEDGYYYFIGSYPTMNDAEDNNRIGYDRLAIRRSKDINGLTNAEEVEVWHDGWKADAQGYHTEGDGTAYYRYFWAPEIHKIGGKWRIITYASLNRNSKWGQMAIFTCEGKDMMDPSAWRAEGVVGKTTDGQTLGGFDTTFMEVNGQCYYVTPKNGKIWITTFDPENVLQPTGPLVQLSGANMAWEYNLKTKQGIDEGPAILQHDGKIFVCYSGATVDQHYCVGMIYADADSDLMDPASWTKYPYPLLTTSDIFQSKNQYGPGHNSFSVDANGNPVIVYHARTWGETIDGAQNDGGLNDPGRHARINSVHFAADGIPVLNMTEEELLAEECKTVTIKVTVKEKQTETETETETETDKPQPTPPETETDKPEPTPPETETDKPQPTPPETETDKPAPKPNETEKPQTPSNELKKGDVVVGEGAYGVYEYRITGKNTAEILRVTKKGKKKATLKIFKTAKLGGKKYKITSVAANALRGNKKVKTLTIEKNIEKIGKNAFANCKNLKRIVIKSTKLKKVGSKAFKGISKKAIVKVPKSKKKSYTKLLQKRGLPKNVKIK